MASGSSSGSSTEEGPVGLSSEEAIRMTEKLMEAESSEDLLELIRPGELNADEALQILSEISTEHGPAQEPLWIGSVDTLTLPTESVVARYKDGHQRLVGLVPDIDGNWRIDFDSFAQLCVPPFEELAEGESNAGLVRVVSNRDTYFNGKYQDEGLWACFALRASSKDATIFAYCLHDSDVMNAMLAVEARTQMVGESRGKKSTNPTQLKSRVTLRLRKDAEASRHQFEIASVISDTWIAPPKPLDEILKSELD